MEASLTVLGFESAEVIPWFMAVCGVFGLIIGSFLNVVIWRVPRGESLNTGSHCPKCGRRITPWQNIPVISWVLLGGKCAGCKERISPRYPLIELFTGIAFAAVSWWVVHTFGWPASHLLPAIGWWAVLIAYLWFTSAGIALIVIDIEHQRLPNAIVAPGFTVITVLLGAAALLNAGGPDWSQLIRVLGGAAALFALYLVIVIIAPNGMGAGDVKLAPVTGAVLGFIGWGALIVGAFAAFVLGALFGLLTIVFGRGARTSKIPFGPFMILGAWIGILFGEPIFESYLVLFGIAA